jgi:hypothetical protein
VARAWEALSLLAPRREVSTLKAASAGEALAEARTCYDHLAGRLGVALADRLLAAGTLEERDGGFVIGDATRLLPALRIDLESLRGRRPLVLRCLDWSECRPHVAGALGAAIATRCFEQGWIERLPSTRAVRITAAGREGFTALGLQTAAG